MAWDRPTHPQLCSHLFILSDVGQSVTDQSHHVCCTLFNELAGQVNSLRGRGCSLHPSHKYTHHLSSSCTCGPHLQPHLNEETVVPAVLNSQLKVRLHCSTVLRPLLPATCLRDYVITVCPVGRRHLALEFIQLQSTNQQCGRYSHSTHTTHSTHNTTHRTHRTQHTHTHYCRCANC